MYAFWMDTARIAGSIQPSSCMCNQFIPTWRDGSWKGIAGGDGRPVQPVVPVRPYGRRFGF